MWSEAPTPVSMAALLDAALDPGWADHHRVDDALAVDLTDPFDLPEPARAGIERWLRALPLPVVGFGASTSPVASFVDVVAEDAATFAEVIANIRANPQAAAVLVQVLRSTPVLDSVQALNLESLGYATLQAGTEFAAWLEDRRGRKPARVVPAKDDMVLIERKGERLEIVLNSPETRNSLSASMRDALTDAFQLVAMDNSISSVDVSGKGTSFSSGGDLEEFGMLTNPAAAHRIRLLRMPARYLSPHADRYRFHLHGACIGAGIELPAFAAHLVAAPDTFFQLPEIGMGLIPGAGGCVSIPRRIGRQKTALMAITNRRINTDVALDWGLIDEIEH